MFVRFRETRIGCKSSLVETRRVEGRVKHQHVASLGSISIDPNISDRMTFWAALHQRLARLSNRISNNDHHKALAAIHERVPMVKADEQRALQRENTEYDLRFWSSLRDMKESNIVGRKRLADSVAESIAELEAASADAAAHTDTAKERLAKIDRGEEVSGGLGKPMTREHFLTIMYEDALIMPDRISQEIIRLYGPEMWAIARRRRKDSA